MSGRGVELKPDEREDRLRPIVRIEANSRDRLVEMAIGGEAAIGLLEEADGEPFLLGKSRSCINIERGMAELAEAGPPIARIAYGPGGSGMTPKPASSSCGSRPVTFHSPATSVFASISCKGATSKLRGKRPMNLPRFIDLNAEATRLLVDLPIDTRTSNR